MSTHQINTSILTRSDSDLYFSSDLPSVCTKPGSATARRTQQAGYSFSKSFSDDRSQGEIRAPGTKSFSLNHIFETELRSGPGMGKVPPRSSKPWLSTFGDRFQLIKHRSD